MARVNWFQAFAEVGLLALGAVIALGGDAWLDAKRDQNEAYAYLTSLREDFGASRQLALEYIDKNVGAQAVAVELLAALEAPSGAVPTDSLNALINGAIWIFDFDPARSTYDDMVSSGGLQLLESMELRLELAAADNDFRSLERFSDLQWQHWMDFELPFLRDHAELAAIYADYMSGGATADLGIQPLSFPDTGFRPETNALRSLIFRNIIVARGIVYQDAIVTATSAVSRMDTILGLVDRELGRAGT